MIELPSRYAKVVQTLSGGGMSETYVCEDANLSRLVVIKTLQPGIEKHRLMDELTALSEIRSKYVVQVQDVVYNGDDIVGFVEEYIDGPSLEPLAAGTPPEAAMRRMYSIAAGIAHVHAHGRVHRDIKPENMKFDSSGVLKIFDFGLAKMSSEAKTKQLYFTPYYSAPEVFLADDKGHHNFTEAVDVFAFGVTAFWMLNGGKLSAPIAKVPPLLPHPEASFDVLAAQFPPEVVSLFNSCLAANPAERPTAEEAQALLGKHLLRGKHRMLLTNGGTGHFVDIKNPNVTLTAQSDSVTINYDGLDFVVTATAGHVRHNNKTVSVGYRLEGTSVIVLGDPYGDRRLRTSITADIANPEVMN